MVVWLAPVASETPNVFEKDFPTVSLRLVPCVTPWLVLEENPVVWPYEVLWLLPRELEKELPDEPKDAPELAFSPNVSLKLEESFIPCVWDVLVDRDVPFVCEDDVPWVFDFDCVSVRELPSERPSF